VEELFWNRVQVLPRRLILPRCRWVLLAFWLFCFVDRPIDMVFSRRREHEADRFGLELTHENRTAATAFAKVMQVGLGVDRPGAIFTIWFDSHPCIADRIEFCNTYRPWETGLPSKYEKYFLPAEGSGGPPLSSAQNSGH
jgi:Zn-dependent protease with chaperone function